MNKKLIAIGIAAVLAAPFAAQAGVEVYGQARVSVDFNNNADDNTGMEKSNMSLSDNASRLGFKGDEDLGGGNSLLWQLEEGVAFDANTAFTGRQSFVGVAGGFGTVLGGKLDTPYKTSTNSWDPFVDTKADYNALMGGDLRTENTVAYVTPNINGFTGAIGYIFPTAGSADDNLPMTKTEKKQNAYSLCGNYAQGPLKVAAAYEVLTKQGATPASPGAEPDNASSWKIGATYTIQDATTLGLIYENQDVGGEVKDHNNIYFLATHKLGDTTLKLAYTKADKWSGTGLDQTGATQISVGASHALTKNTEVYALYSQISNDDSADYGLNGGPGAVVKVSGVSSDPSVLSIGINHTFSSK